MGTTVDISRKEEGKISFPWLLPLHNLQLDASSSLRSKLASFHFLYKISFFLMKVVSSSSCVFKPNKGNNPNMGKNLIISLHFTHTFEEVCLKPFLTYQICVPVFSLCRDHNWCSCGCYSWKIRKKIIKGCCRKWLVTLNANV